MNNSKQCTIFGRGSSYHHNIVATFSVISAINLFNFAVCAVMLTSHLLG